MTDHAQKDFVPSSEGDSLNGFGILIPFVKELGFVLNYFENGSSEIIYSPKPEHFNSFDVAHGGSVMTLLDVSMATAARSVDKTFGIVTIEMKTSFLRPSTGTLKALGTLMHRTRTTAFVQSSVYNEAGELCAHSTGTFRYVQRKPHDNSKSGGTGGESIGESVGESGIGSQKIATD